MRRAVPESGGGGSGAANKQAWYFCDGHGEETSTGEGATAMNRSVSEASDYRRAHLSRVC